MKPKLDSISFTLMPDQNYRVFVMGKQGDVEINNSWIADPSEIMAFMQLRDVIAASMDRRIYGEQTFIPSGGDAFKPDE